MRNSWLRINKVAEFEEITQRSAERKVKRGDYIYRKVPSDKHKGKMVTEILVSSLTDKGIRNCEKHFGRGAAKPIQEKTEKSTGEEQGKWYGALPEEHRAVVDSRLELLDEFARGLRTSRPGHGKKGEFVKSFCQNKGISESTLDRLQADYKKHGLLGLANWRFGQSRTKLTQEMQDYIVGLIVGNPDRRPARIFEYVSMRFPGTPITSPTIGSFVDQWKTKNHREYMALSNPDKFKNYYMPAFGDMAEKAKHFCHYWELDSTPADVMCSDGKRYHIVGAIDIFSRKVKVKVVRSSNSEAIAALLRLCILDWGIPNHIIKDNGKDYASKHISGICNSLKIKTPKVAPFTPEAKPFIERFFWTLSYGFLEELGGYIGHNVAQRKAIDSRKSFAQRFMKKGETVQLSLSSEELQKIIDLWITNIYHQKKHRGKAMGMSPEIKAAQSTVPLRKITDVRALDILLLKQGKRTVTKKGISYENGLYQAVNLMGFVGEEVEVARDAEDSGKLYVSLNGQYVCTAYDERLGGIAAEELARNKSLNKKEIRATINALKKLESVSENPMQQLISQNRENKKIVSLVRKVEAELPAIAEAGKAANDAAGVKPRRVLSIREQIEEGRDVAPPGPYEGGEEDEIPNAWMDDFEVVNE